VISASQQLLIIFIVLSVLALVVASKTLLLKFTGVSTHGYIDQVVPEVTRSQFIKEKYKCRLFFKYTVNGDIHRASKLYSPDELGTLGVNNQSCIGINYGDSLEIEYSTLIPGVISVSLD